MESSTYLTMSVPTVLKSKYSRKVVICAGIFFPTCHYHGFAAQFSPQTTGKKPSGTQGKHYVNNKTTVEWIKCL